MLEYDNFKELICNELQRSLDREDFFVELKISDADNTINKKKDKLSVVDPARPDAFPIFYLNDIYKYYNECGDMYITVKEVVNEVKRAFCNIPKIEFDKVVDVYKKYRIESSANSVGLRSLLRLMWSLNVSPAQLIPFDEYAHSKTFGDVIEEMTSNLSPKQKQYLLKVIMTDIGFLNADSSLIKSDIEYSNGIIVENKK